MNQNQPAPEPTQPACPAWLDETAKAVWKQVVPRLSQMQVVAAIDANILSRYCTLWARWQKAEQFLVENGETYTTRNKSGATYHSRHPQVGIAATLSAQLTRIEAELGMSPSSRTRITVLPQEAPSEVDERRKRYSRI